MPPPSSPVIYGTSGDMGTYPTPHPTYRQGDIYVHPVCTYARNDTTGEDKTPGKAPTPARRTSASPSANISGARGVRYDDTGHT